TQWEPYDGTDEKTETSVALAALANWLKERQLTRLITTTRLFLAPGYRFRIAKRLITNLHQPRSTLLLLVAAAIGSDWKKVYQYALDHDFRFLSYGDSSLLEWD
ncbi:MAG: S-adenosylmethionine:tRNA ribosyltransferase-isomerase, partial [Chitinophagaceae bacterium]